MTIHMTAHLLNPASILLLGVITYRVASTVWDSTAWLVALVRTYVPAKPGETAA